MNNRLIRAMVLLLALKFLASEAYRTAVVPNGISNIAEYHAAAKRLSSHQPLYIQEQGPVLANQYVSSPLIPLLLRPLARLSPSGIAHLWAALNVSLLVAAGALFCWAAGLGFLDAVAPVLLVLFTAFRYWPTVLELGMGNVDIILLLTVCAMFVCDRYGKWMWFALVVALAALTKTWMIGALFYLLARRKWREAFAGGVFFAAGLAVLFSLVGWREFSQWIDVTRRYSSQPQIVSHSVAGISRLFFSANLIMTPLVNSAAVHLLALVLGYGVIVSGLLYLWWRGPDMSEYQARLCLGLTPLALVLGSSVSHQYYFVLALPLFWMLLLGPATSSNAWAVRIAAFVLYLAFSVPTPGDPLPDAFKHGFRSLEVSLTFVTGMLLWGLGLYAFMREFPACEEKQVPAAPSLVGQTAART